MSSSIGILNYFAFFILYIICFVFIYRKFSEIIGFYVLIVVNIAFLLYALNDVIQIFEYSDSFILMIACFAVITGLIFHTVLIIFILMMSNNLNIKYTKRYGTPFNLPKKYQKNMDLIKFLMIASFFLGCIILYILFYYNNELEYNFINILKYFNITKLFEYRILFFTLTASLILLGISSYQVYIGNEFSKLSKQKLMDKPKK